MNASRIRFFLVFIAMAACCAPASAQAGSIQGGSASRSGSTTNGFLIYGDVKVVDAEYVKNAPMILDLILYTKGMQVAARQRINPNGRYRFMDVYDGDYWLVVEHDGVEVMRDSLFISKSMTIDIKHDINLNLRPTARRTGDEASTGIGAHKKSGAIAGAAFVSSLRSVAASGR